MLAEAKGQCVQVLRRQVKLHMDGTIPEKPAAVE